MTYLVVGLDHHTLTPWTRHILAGDVRTAIRTARSRAAAEGVALAVAAVIGPNSTLLHARPARASRATSPVRYGAQDTLVRARRRMALQPGLGAPEDHVPEAGSMCSGPGLSASS